MGFRKETAKNQNGKQKLPTSSWIFNVTLLLLLLFIIILVVEDVNSQVIRQIHIQIRMQKVEKIMSDDL